jgi:acetyl esterase/lipase
MNAHVDRRDWKPLVERATKSGAARATSPNRTAIDPGDTRAMSTLHLVRDELRPFLNFYPLPEMDANSLAAIRAAPAMAYPPSPEVPGVTVEQRFVERCDGQPDVRVLIYFPSPGNSTRPAILHMHGGGLVLGAPEMSDASNRKQASALDVVIVSVDYRLPPEHPFPAPLEDCYAVLRWLHGNAASLGVDPDRIAVKGESAGGGLAASLALLARDRGEVPLSFQCLTYPMIDDRTPGGSHPYAGEFIWTARSNRFGWDCYLGDRAGADNVSGYAAAARAEDLRGLPPALIVTTALDLFLEENLEYARRLTRAGVPVELLVYPGAYHGFQMAGDSEINRRYERDIREVLAQAL